MAKNKMKILILSIRRKRDLIVRLGLSFLQADPVCPYFTDLDRSDITSISGNKMY
jgi:hypothetical protein